MHALGLPELVFDRDLRLAVGLQVGNDAFLPSDGKAVGQRVGERDGEWHELVGLVACEADHHALVAGAQGVDLVLVVASAVLQGGGDALIDVGGLLVEPDDDRARLVVDPDLWVVVADAPDRVADDGLVIDLRGGRYLTDNRDEVGAGGWFACDTRGR